MIGWLSAWPHLRGWRDYLASRELEEQFRRGEDADPDVVGRALRRYSSGAAGLDHRHFVAVRLALRNWLVTLAPRSGAPAREADPPAVLRRAETSVLPASTHREARATTSQAASAATDASQVQEAVPAWISQMPHETSACVMVRRRFLAAIRGPLLVHSPHVLVPCVPVVAKPLEQHAAEGIAWRDDYFAACREARRRQAMLFVSFYDPARPGCEAVHNEELGRLAASTRGCRYVWARFPLDYRTIDEGSEICLVDHPAFAELRGQPGIAVIDYENPAAKHYRQVVSLFPIRNGSPYGARELAAMLDLPPGTLTQRTMIYAVRTHPHFPQSAIGLPHHELLSESESHSHHQADIAVQGHHDWEGRFHRINAKLGQMGSREVVAESWPGESLLDAAIECVHCWHQSAGHWDAVSARHAEYGYDMKRGSNGIWYATGLFGD